MFYSSSVWVFYALQYLTNLFSYFKSFNCNKIINESCDENEKHDKKDVVKEEKKVKSQEKVK